MKLLHILREGNKCADTLARYRGLQREMSVRILIPANEIVEDMIADLQGTKSIDYCSSCIIIFPRKFCLVLTKLLANLLIIVCYIEGRASEPNLGIGISPIRVR